MNTSPLRVLCLDIEGGYGGSSRSLFETIRCLPHDKVLPEVWCRKTGPIQNQYQMIGVPVLVKPAMPAASAVARTSRNLIVFLQLAYQFLMSKSFRRDLVKAVNQRFDIVHFNIEPFWFLALWLRKKTDKPFTMHIRTRLVNTPFSRLQARAIASAINHLIFITENEQAWFEKLAGQKKTGSVIFNTVSPDIVKAEPLPKILAHKSFKVASLSNFDVLRGTDLLVPLAQAFRIQNRTDVVFVMAGNMKLPRSLPGDLGSIGAVGGTFKDYVKKCGLEKMFLFLGHVAFPERVIASCDALIKPTREGNPWGRDILEGLAAGKPVISVGKYNNFVEDGVTGILQDVFDAPDLARRIIQLIDDKNFAKNLGSAGRKRVLELCDGNARGNDLLLVWQDTIQK